MKAEYSEQYRCVCLVLDGTENADDIIERAVSDEAIFYDGEDECFCLRFPERPQELYTKNAIIRTCSQRWQK